MKNSVLITLLLIIIKNVLIFFVPPRLRDLRKVFLIYMKTFKVTKSYGIKNKIFKNIGEFYEKCPIYVFDTTSKD